MSSLTPYTAPAFKADGFNCPFCHAYAEQLWGMPHLTAGSKGVGQQSFFWTCRCSRCSRFSVWIDERLVFPTVISGPAANPDLSADILGDYEEARQIALSSPRGAAALLRLAIQKLCRELGEPGKNINDDIATLVRKGLPIPVQQALDIVRVVGNNAVHPGQIDVRDDVDSVSRLFGLVNLIAEVMISQPKHVRAMYEAVVPESQRQAIAARDAKPGAV